MQTSEAVTFTFVKGPGMGRLPPHHVHTLLSTLPAEGVYSMPARDWWGAGEIKLRLWRPVGGEARLAVWTRPARDITVGNLEASIIKTAAGHYEDLATGRAVYCTLEESDDDDAGWYEAPLSWWRESGLRRPLGYRRWVHIEVDTVDVSKQRDGFCSYCGDQSAKPKKRCGRCMRACYCGPDCQRAHWAAHKLDCR